MRILPKAIELGFKMALSRPPHGEAEGVSRTASESLQRTATRRSQERKSWAGC